MLTFKQFLIREAEEAAPKLKRQGIAEILNDHAEDPEKYSLTPKELQNMTSSGSMDFSHVTEKTDGQPHKVVYDPERGSISLRNSVTGYDRHLDSRQAIEDHCRQAFNKNPKTKDIPGGYDGDHPLAQRKRRIAAGIADHLESLQNNPKFTSYMKKKSKESGGHVVVSGELFRKEDAKTVNDYDPEDPSTHETKNLHPNESMSVVTPYSNDRIQGKKGMFVVHTAMNPDHDPEELKKAMRTDDFGTDDDVIHHNSRSMDVSEESKALNKLLYARTGDTEFAHPDPKHPINNMSVSDLLDQPADKKDAGHIQSRQKAWDAYANIARQVKQKATAHLSDILSQSKWNSNKSGPNGESREPEGVVVHGEPKIKILSPRFASIRQQEQAQKATQKAAKKK
jgi:hypothetical protein